MPVYGSVDFRVCPAAPSTHHGNGETGAFRFPVRYLLDVNVLLAWGWADHSDHHRVVRWLGDVKNQEGAIFLTSSIPQLGFVRVSVQRTAGQVSPVEAGLVLAGMLGSPGIRHEFLPDDQDALQWPAWCRTAGATTDAHLLALATAHGAVLATLDRGIPGAHLIPPL